MYKNYDGFSKGVGERVKDGRPLRSAHCEETVWAAYFEGNIEGKCSTVVADTTAEMLTGLQQQVSDNELSLECIVYGEGAWFTFYLQNPSHDQGDTNWVVNNKYVGEGSFQESLGKYCDSDVSLRKVCFGENVWFGYWEGTVSETSGWAWHSDPTLDGFLAKIKSEWDADDDDAAAPASGGEAAAAAAASANAAAAEFAAASGASGGEAAADSALKLRKTSIALPVVEKKEYKTEGGMDWGEFVLTDTAIPGPLADKDETKLKEEWLKKFKGHEAKFNKGVGAGSMTEKTKTKLLSDTQKDFDKIADKAKKLAVGCNFIFGFLSSSASFVGLTDGRCGHLGHLGNCIWISASQAKFVKAEEKRLAKEAKAAAKKT
jgi:hypothetical protein